VVDEEVESSLVALHPFEQRGDLLVVAQVERDGNAPAAARVAFRRRLTDGARQWRRPFLDSAPGDIDGRALPRERERNALADSPARAGDDGDLARERSHDHSPPGIFSARRLTSGRW